ncbi:MAG: helix-turn-helix domain-containing protein [Ruminococcaceae bacterium]|nr:helix-turn-helix domain-containing protein [Oscillospiraceae bacterium]
MKKVKSFLLYILKYMTTYLLIIALFVVLLSHLYFQLRTQTRDSILDKSYKKIENGISVIDGKIGDMYRFASLIRENSAVSSIVKFHDDLENREYYFFNKAQNAIREIQNIYDLKCSVIFKENNFFLSDNFASENFEAQYKLYASYEKLSPYEMRDIIFSQSRYVSYIPSQAINHYTEGNKDFLTCAIKMPVNASMRYDSAVVFLMETEDIIDSLLNDAEKGNRFLCITNDEGETLLEFNCSSHAIEESNEKYHTQRINNEKYYVFRKKSTYSNLTAIVGISEKAFKEELSSVLRIIQFYIFISLFLALAACAWFAFRQATFVKDTISLFSEKGTKKIKNDYGYIQSRVRAISEENILYKNDKERLQEYIRDSMLEKMLLYGVYDHAEKADIEHYVGNSMERYVLVCVTTDNVDIVEGMSINETVRNMLENKFSVITIQNGTDESNFIVLFDGSVEEIEEIKKFLKGLIHQFTSITISISEIGTGIENVNMCYRQAKNMLRQIFDPRERFICYKKSDELNINKVFDETMAKQLREFVALGQRCEVEKVFVQIRENLSHTVMDDEQEIMQLFFEIKGSLEYAYINILKNTEMKNLPRYNFKASLYEMINVLEEFAVLLCDSIKEKKRSRKDELKQRITEYLYDNYSNPNLCAAMVAREFSLSEKYIFTVVKEHTGKTFNEFVEGVRLDKAKEYLTQTDMPINKIASLIGFNTIDTFYKAFKRVYGIAPGKWKENN